ncbi:hypothetical protein RvY_11240 [Ramazzottius varieornatus]|uniref:Spaetzle domain-containing protein n=1 Tax=Ramazzottius varieornatus TaxID=947166 RepID=A0A1D1VFH4_RAMVA|nr:hypothetical protein RvY_11240 [Ramazzottius varieornatus]
MKRMFGTVSSRSLLRKDEEEVAMDNSDLRKKRMAKPPQTPQQLPPFEQAIHTVKCARGQPGRCHPTRPCWCTQEYSWFRLLAYDATDNCKGIFMDWFKFPSHCACKCVQAAAATAENGASVPVSVAPLLPT